MKSESGDKVDKGWVTFPEAFIKCIDWFKKKKRVYENWVKGKKSFLLIKPNQFKMI